MARMRFRVVAAIVAALGLPPAAAGAWALGLNISGNIHEVVPGAFYRSAQLDGQDLASLITAHGIKTVINLRGEHVGEGWYDDELRSTEYAGARHLDITLSANHQPDAATMAQLMTMLETAERPILVHCQGGADRSGLASALYEYVVQHAPADDASGQLSFRYGHFPWLWSRSGAMDRAFADFVASAGPR